MTIEYHELLGDRVDPGQLALPKARVLAEALSGDARPFVTLVECRIKGDIELVIFDVEVERGQTAAHPIRRDERLAAIFDRADQTLPQVWALRKDFPQVPHLNVAPFDTPKSLCLYDEPYRDLKKRWTAVRFLERIREWLALTAKGILHQDDQPLEPLIAGHKGTIVLPAALAEPGEPGLPTQLSISATCTDPDHYFLIAEPRPTKGEKSGIHAVASIHVCPPQRHGLMQWCPRNLKQLARLLADAGADLVGELRARFRDWEAERIANPRLLDGHLVLLVLIPKVREEGSAPESQDTWTFITSASLREVGVKLGIWQLTDGRVGWLLAPGDDASEELGVELLNPSYRLSRGRAARLSGHRPDDAKALAIGAGALGSQVLMNLARSGFGTWHIVDHDRLLPHNLVRHELPGDAVGFHKAEALALQANSLTEAPPVATAIPADLLDPGDRAEGLAEAIRDAAFVLDMSASVTVARHLALRADAPARRMSLFMNPTGEDLVLLAEDAGRRSRLDSLEMQYYRALAAEPALSGHYRPAARNRYGQSCRDITSDIPQDQVALHAALGARAVRQANATPAARISIWRTGQDGTVRRVDVPPAPTILHKAGDWTLCTDVLLIHRLAQLRESKLPNETGGILLGSFDLEQKIVYLVDTIPSPPDSQEWPTLYIRGAQGLEPAVAQSSARTDGMLEYVGEWHSHPRGCSTAPSDDDLEGFVRLTDLMGRDGLPAVILIVGDGGDASCFIGLMPRNELLLPRVP